MSALPLFGDAYLADTQHLTLEEHGAYLKLLLIAWRSPACALPNDDRRIATMLGIGMKKWLAIRPAVMAFWSLSEHGWQQKRLLKERRWVDDKANLNKQAAEARWGRKPLKTDEPTDPPAYPNGDAPPPPPLPTKEKKNHYTFCGKVIRLTPQDYDAWQQAYPALDLSAALQSRDDWLADQDATAQQRWFMSTSNWLRREQQKTKPPPAKPLIGVSGEVFFGGAAT